MELATDIVSLPDATTSKGPSLQKKKKYSIEGKVKNNNKILHAKKNTKNKEGVAFRK